MKALTLSLRMLVGLAFAYAGVVKITAPAVFAQDIGNYRLLPWAGCVAVALFLPWLELFCGAALLAGRLRRGATALVFAMLALFLAALASAKLRGLDIHCGCFGRSRESTVGQEMLVVIVLAALLAVSLAAGRRKTS